MQSGYFKSLQNYNLSFTVLVCELGGVHLCGCIRISVAVSRHLSGPPHVVIADGLPPNAGCGLLKPLHTLVHFLCQRIKD